ncbi:MAG: hypothetical protein MI723_02640 [Caulobacterales bacterium]|nr:hypothetical protein [Caulobacterales bacterium]
MKLQASAFVITAMHLAGCATMHEAIAQGSPWPDGPSDVGIVEVFGQPIDDDETVYDIVSRTSVSHGCYAPGPIYVGSGESEDVVLLAVKVFEAPMPGCPTGLTWVTHCVPALAKDSGVSLLDVMAEQQRAVIGRTRIAFDDLEPMPEGMCSEHGFIDATDAGADGGEADPLLAHGPWNAWVSKLPPEPDGLFVAGWLVLPHPGHAAALVKSEPQGVTSTNLLLDLIIEPLPGPWTQVETLRAVSYAEEPYTGGYNTATIRYRGDTLHGVGTIATVE